ncbi:MAG TPA: hypothetical protein ENH10_05655 [Bacteroidetes bacterium]|nr:hypothetical protein BMS3Bbin04_01592 [bacterium BMS3Bbin04]HDO65505.1 hypothetical protein [Bacteroidota bacterium]HEX04630.1 hypothetical protein [Bacteroidota bacterium]
MTRESSRSRTRMWILINYSTCAVLVAMPLVLRMLENWWLRVGVLLVLTTLMAISIERAFGRTHLWSLTRKKSHELDEREVELTYNALAIAYRVMSIVLLAAMYLIILSHDELLMSYLGWAKPIASVLAIGLIYMAQTLPSVIIGWRELPMDDEGVETTV